MQFPDADVTQLINEVLGDHRNRVVRELGGFDDTLWRTLGEVGLDRLTGAEASGGSELSWLEASVLASRTGYYAAAVPVVEHDLLAGWLLDQLEGGYEPIEADGLVLTVARLDADGRARQVAWAPVADAFVVSAQTVAGSEVALVPADAVAVTETEHLALRPTGDVKLTAQPRSWASVPPATVAELTQRGSLARALQICGALERIVELSTEHVTTRVQFGRPLAKFQAVQFTVVDMAAETALARMASEAAVRTAIRDGFHAETTRFAIAAARSCCGHAASVAVRAAHQVHGAIGTTVEHQLHEYTRAILAWRSEYGTTVEADRFLSEKATSAGASGAWQMVLNASG